ncbi:MAG: tetratricopeptide repeat protein [Candidatus Brocadiaceae bacterium]|nr:tetratricopeptide repeat protein [Candidatus Brocadiaceae bacterium]
MAKAPERPEPSEHDIILRFLERAKAVLQKNGLHILLVVLAVTVVVLLYRTHLLRQKARAYDSWELLGGLHDPVDLLFRPAADAEAVRNEELAMLSEALDRPGDSRARPWLLLTQGALLAANGRRDEALAAYEQVKKRHPESALLADSATAVVLEEAGGYAEAAAVCERLAPGLPACWIDAGRCRELAGEPEKARAAYERALREDLEKTLEGLAAARLAALDRGALLPPPPHPAAPSPAPEAPAPLAVPGDTPAAP